MVRSIKFLPAILLAAVLIVSCSGQDTSVEEEEAASEAPVESLPAYDPGPDTDLEICQTEEALEDLGPEGLERLSDELSEEVSAGRFASTQKALAARGYTCDGQA